MNYPWTDPLKKLKKALENSKKEEPIRYTPEELQDFLESIKNRDYPLVNRIWDKIRFGFYDFTWYVYRLYKPCNQRIRKAIPRSWCDLTELTLLVNFEIIKSFVENEMNSIEWNSDEHHKAAAAWLNSSYKYITEERVQLEEDLRIAYNNVDYRSELPYGEKYKEVHRIEKTIEESDKSVIIGLANYRNFLWS
jgi:hypothetical protein